jgi:hypothetical protein
MDMYYSNIGATSTEQRTDIIHGGTTAIVGQSILQQRYERRRCNVLDNKHHPVIDCSSTAMRASRCPYHGTRAENCRTRRCQRIRSYDRWLVPCKLAMEMFLLVPGRLGGGHHARPSVPDARVIRTRSGNPSNLEL